MRYFFILLILIFTHKAHADEGSNITSLPLDLPVKIYTNFELHKLISIAEQDETFVIDCSGSFAWHDPRLAYTATNGKKVKYFLTEDAIDEQVHDMWWPMFEFLNYNEINYHNKALFIYPDGRVEYYIRFIGDFLFSGDYRKFPFDTQKLSIRIDSFLWDTRSLIFVPSSKHLTVGDHLESFGNKGNLISVLEREEVIKGIALSGLSGTREYSQYSIDILNKRDSSFIIYQVFLPLLLLMSINYLSLFLRGDIANQLILFITCFLVLVATKFTINSELPQTEYFTAVDSLFLISYLIITLSVFLCFLVYKLDQKNKKIADKIYAITNWIIPLFFYLGIALIIFLIK